jgi:hypothetical protein
MKGQSHAPLTSILLVCLWLNDIKEGHDTFLAGFLSDSLPPPVC